MTDKNALELKDLSVAYRVGGRNRAVLRNVNLTIGAGESYGLVGESGCGKSTVALSVVRYLPRNGSITGGSIALDGQDLMKLDAEAVWLQWPLVLTLTVAPVFFKFVLVTLLARAFGAAPGVALRTGLYLAQAKTQRSFFSPDGGLPRIYLRRRQDSGRVYQARRPSFGKRSLDQPDDRPPHAAALSGRLHP